GAHSATTLATCLAVQCRRRRRMSAPAPGIDAHSNGAGDVSGRGRAVPLRCAHGFPYVWLTARTRAPTPTPLTAGHPGAALCSFASVRGAAGPFSRYLQ